MEEGFHHGTDRAEVLRQECPALLYSVAGEWVGGRTQKVK